VTRRAEIAAAAEAAGRPVPDAVLDAPTLDPAAELFWGQWHVWHRRRQYAGMGAVPVGIDETKVEAWARSRGIDPDDALRLIDGMDAEYAEHLRTVTA
jgi:hypothetical protein